MVAVNIVLVIAIFLILFVLLGYGLDQRNKYRKVSKALDTHYDAHSENFSDYYKYFEYYEDYKKYIKEPAFKANSTSYKNGVLIRVGFVNEVDRAIKAV
jgi:hypothetical protein